MKVRFILPALCLAAACATMPSSVLASNLVSDGDFATGGAPWFTTQTNDNFPWGWGGGSASTGCVGASCITGAPGQLADLDQDLSTVSGDPYVLSFQYSSADGTPNELEVLFGGTEAADLLNQDGSTNTFTFDVTATSDNTELTFLGRQDPSFNVLTDVSVTGASNSPVPEPSSLLLLGTGLAGLALLAGQKLKARKLNA